jgi:hypothetical protein
MRQTGAHLYFEFATEFLLYYSHDCHSSACLQLGPNPPVYGHQLEQPRRCGVAAQRWRLHIKSLVDGHYSNVPHVPLRVRFKENL